MKQNIYDDDAFFSAYTKYRNAPGCINSIIEQPVLRSLLPNLAGTRVLDIGCGAGSFCGYALAKGADFVLGLDISQRMCAQARSSFGDNLKLKIINQAIEDFEWSGQPFDVITSSLTMHYVEPLATVLEGVSTWLKPGHPFLMSVNHPIYTADLGMTTGGIDTPCCVRNYWNEDVRTHTWFVDGVAKYHRTIETYVRLLNSAGLSLKGLHELSPTSAAVKEWDGDPNLAERPIFILFETEKS